MTSRSLAEVAGRCAIRLVIAAVMALVSLPFPVRAQAVGKQVLPGHVPAAIARFHLQPLRAMPATNRLHLAIGLPLRNQEELSRLLAQIYDPASTNYQHYLTPEQFAARFGPTEQDYQALVNFAQTNGLTVTATYPNRALLDVSGDAATIEKVFHVKLNVYQHPTENRTFYAPDVEPAINLNVPILHVSGLDNFSLPRPAALKKNPLNPDPAGATPAAGTGPNGSYMGNDFRAAYAPGVNLDGSGQMVGLLEFDGYLKSDITNYAHQAGLPCVPLINVLVDPKFDGTPSSDDTEVCLDIEMAISMATNLAAVVVFEAGTSYNFDSLLAGMAASNQIKQFSSSWGYSGSPDTNADQIFMNMAAQGQSFFQASGDGDAYYNPIWVPAASPYVTSVGGTKLTMNGSGASYGSETVWNLGYSPPAWAGGNGDGYWGGGGGVSADYPIPSWQQGINMTTNQGSTAQRNIPDVAMTAANIFVVANNGQSESSVYGTSAAAPLWAGFIALANQQAANLGRPAVGFLNPAIYAIGKGPNYAVDFHDITQGNNFSSNSPANYPAVPGYDLCTGWGTPNGQNLINALVPPDTLGIVPAIGFVATGPAGGPFSPATENLFLTNSGAGSLTWSLINTSAWLNASAAGGTLAASATNSVTMSLTPAASGLGVGTYVAVVNFSNWNTRVVQPVPFTLLALQPLVVAPTNGFTASGPAAGPFNPAAGSFQVTNTGNAPLNWSLVNTSAWLTASGGGTLAAGASTAATVSLNSAATNLATGNYTATVWLTNQTGGGARSLQFGLLVNQITVQNGGFETGDFTGWSFTGNISYTLVTSFQESPQNSPQSPIYPHLGSFFALLGEQYAPAYLSQTVPTLPGQAYLLSLWLNSPTVSSGNTPNEFSVTWNGNKLFDQTNIAATSGWTNLQFIVTATGTSATLQFGERDDNWYLGLDDVNLTSIPAAVFQPTRVAITNNNLKFAWNALTGLVYQVQFKTNLLQANWAALKNVPATNTTVTFVDTNPVTGSPQKFYRLQLLP